MANDSYDYVIVGAGSAGAVLAARLTEDPATSVLLLEAGGEADADEVMIPAAFPTLFKTRWDWNYTTTEQKQLHNRRAYWPRMKALGGCSSMNAMIYIRGNRADYDAWRDEYGAAGWGYDDVLPYFSRAEDNTRLGAPYHGQDGPLHVEDRRYTHELSHALVDSAVSAGLKPTDDFNGAEQEGAGLYQVTCKGGRRWSVDDAYLRPARGRSNLDRDHRRVRHPDRARGGPGHRGDLPAGRRRAHGPRRPRGAAVRWRGQQPAAADALGHRAGRPPAEHGIDGRGRPARRGREPPGPPGGADALVHPRHHRPRPAQQPRATSRAGRPAAPVRWPPTSGRAAPSSPAATGSPPPTCRSTRARRASTTTGSTSRPAGCSPPRRRWCRSPAAGSVRLRSTDPSWHPAIDAAYFDDQTDLDALLAGARRTWEIVHAGRGQPLPRPALEPARTDPSDEDLVEHIRNWAQTLYHPVATCAMGSGEDAVVDADLRVRGVDGLRVVDASVMPAVPRGNTNAPTIMLAEKAADEIRSSR